MAVYDRATKGVLPEEQYEVGVKSVTGWPLRLGFRNKN